METIKEALTFDDVTLAPNYSSILPSEVNTSVNLTESLNIKIPLLSSAMDTVTESSMGIAIGRAGGLGIIHRNLNIQDQIKEIRKVKSKKILIGAAVGASEKELNRAEKILKENLDIIVIDTAHGHTKKVGDIIKKIKKIRPKKTAICAGNIATAEAAKFLVGLEVARHILQRKKFANKQIFMITDGKPSCMLENGKLYKNSFGLDRKIVNKVLDEAVKCRREKITITTFMIASDPYLQHFVREMTEANKGKAYFSSLDNLGGFIFEDYIKNRKRRVH